MEELKDLYKYDVEATPNILEIRSETIPPLSQSAYKYVFRLEPTGLLDQHSLLLFKLKNVASGAPPMRVNCFNGVLGAIQRCQLAVGDWIISDVDSVDEWATLENFVSKSRSHQNAVMSHYLGNAFHSKVSDKDVSDGTYKVQGKGEIIPDPKKCGVRFGGSSDGTNATGSYDETGEARILSHPIFSDELQNPVYAVPLGMIFPCLQGRTIPLFLFDEYRINLTIWFNTADKFVNRLDKVNYGSNEYAKPTAGDVSFYDVKLQVDYIIQPSQLQEAERKKLESGYVMDFYDVIKNENQLPEATAGVLQRQEFRLGVANKEVHKIYMVRKFIDTTGYGRNLALLGEQRCDSVNEEAINYNINGLDEFSENDIYNNAVLYHQVSSCQDMPLPIERPMFFNSLDTQFSMMAGKTNPLNSTYKPLGVDLRNGVDAIVGGGRKCGSYPIVVKYSRNATDDVATAADTPGFRKDLGAQNVNFHIMTSRRVVVKSGVKGNTVNVSY